MAYFRRYFRRGFRLIYLGSVKKMKDGFYESSISLYVGRSGYVRLVKKSTDSRPVQKNVSLQEDQLSSFVDLFRSGDKFANTFIRGCVWNLGEGGTVIFGRRNVMFRDGESSSCFGYTEKAVSSAIDFVQSVK